MDGIDLGDDYRCCALDDGHDGPCEWRCSDCGSLADHQQPIAQYLDENSLEVLDRNLREWGSVKGVRPAYRMLKSARFKCLMTLSRRRQSAPAAT